MASKDKVKLGVILSGRGSNFEAIQRHIDTGLLSDTGVRIACVLSNRAEAAGLDIARQHRLPVAVFDGYAKRVDRDTAMLETLRAHGVDWVILAGYDRIVGDPLLSAYHGRILNIHPSLLPLYGGKGMVGLAVHQAVIAAGETETGCTVHQVTDDVDGGEILGQARVPVLPDDTPERLAQRVLVEEHRLYASVIRQVCCQHLTLKAEV